ncbi:hypothetical protein [Candidatus Parabeggiatoa sp. HSG14]|uniref:hypothetical protein n=1 Tax=Candidatus Parabeggiatoa sp. HSG14 TaxID=3055593 RepID=UPI0025A7F787|nr:hypothetical protein [Thiotrichales bacterium HSG14]
MMVVLKVMKRKLNYLLSGLFALLSSIAAAEDWSLGGHIKYQFVTTHYQNDNLYAQYGPQSPIDNFLDLRLTAENRWGAWDAQIHYEVLALYGDSPKTRKALTNIASTATTLPRDNRRLLKLTSKWENNDELEAVQRLDRLFVGYSGEQLVFRAGRQIVSWGNGFVFHPLDIFSPFSPTAIDKDYKTGDDMLYGQWLFDSGDDLQMILLPRRNPDTNDVESEQSSFAFKYRGRYKEQWDFDLLGARHFDENVVGFGLTKDIFEALWRLDMSATRLKEGGTTVSLVTNMDYSWVLFKKNFYGFIEYFHNGVGETQTHKYISPESTLQTRLQRGEVYTLGRDYFSSGVQIELTPLFNFYTNWIANLHDNSGLFQIRGIYDWTENLQLIGWIDKPYGNEGTEFGGISIEGSDGYLAPGQRFYLRLIYYF